MLRKEDIHEKIVNVSWAGLWREAAKWRLSENRCLQYSLGKLTTM